MLETDEGDRLRRLSAVMRFLAQVRESASERELVVSLIQAAAVWYDLDARAYRRQLNGRFVLDAWLPGADVTPDPQELDVQTLLTPDRPTHISAIAELEQLGWKSIQGEVLLLPIAAGDHVRRLMVMSGPVEHEIEATLMLVCRSAGAVLEQIVEHRGQEIRDRLARRMAGSGGSYQACVRGVMEEFVAVIGGAAVRVAVTHPAQPPLTVFSTGGEGWATEPVPPIAPGVAHVGSERIALGFALGNDRGAVIELLASAGAPFTVERAHAARVGGSVLSVWLAGISVGASQHQGDAQALAEPAPPPFEDEVQAELARAKRLSLSGGLLVASVPGAAVPDPRVLSIVIQAVRGELRSSDLLGQLAGGDIAAVLVRTSSEGVARAAVRVRERLDALARCHQLPQVVVGHALYPAGAGESPASLVGRARRDAGLVFS